MPSYHVNPATGNVGPCRAQTNCPFGNLETEHHATRHLAQAAYEATMQPRVFTGLPQIDQAIQDYTLVVDKRLRDPLWADGKCGQSSYEFSRYLQERGIPATAEVQDDEDEPYGAAWGYDDREVNTMWGQSRSHRNRN